MYKPFPTLENETRLVLDNIKPNESLSPVKKSYLLQTFSSLLGAFHTTGRLVFGVALWIPSGLCYLCLTQCWYLVIQQCCHSIYSKTGPLRLESAAVETCKLKARTPVTARFRSGMQWTMLQGRGNGKQGQLC